MAKGNAALVWGPYQDWAKATSCNSGRENAKADDNIDEGSPGLWGPLFASVEEKSSVLPGSVAARRAVRTFREFVEKMRSHEAPVRPPKPPEADQPDPRSRPAWRPFRLSPEVGRGNVLLKRGQYQTLFVAGDPISLLKIAELNDEVRVRRGALVVKGELSWLVRHDFAATELDATMRTAGLNVVWDKQLKRYLANKRRHMVRQQTPFEAVPEELRTEHRSFSAMPKKLRRQLSQNPAERVPESLRPQYTTYRKRLTNLGLAGKLNEMQAHDASLLACKERAIAGHEQGLGKTRTCIATVKPAKAALPDIVSSRPWITVVWVGDTLENACRAFLEYLKEIVQSPCALDPLRCRPIFRGGCPCPK